MSLGGHKTFMGQDRVAIVVGGHAMTPLGLAQDNSGKMMIKDPTTMGAGVMITDLPFSIRDRSPDYFSQCSTPGLLDPGKMVYARGDLGGKLKITAIPDETYQDTAVPTNNNMLAFAGFLTSINMLNPFVWQPPNAMKTVDKGAVVYRPIEKSPFSHNMLKGLPSSGTTFPLIGMRLPPELNIPTALQPFANLLGGGLLGQLPGIAMNLGLMLLSLKNDPVKYKLATQDMPRETLSAFESLTNLSQSAIIDTANNGNSVISLTGFRVDPNTFVDNVATVYAQCKSLNDLIECTHELVSNTEYHGMSNFENVRVVYETPYGNTTIYITPDGEIATDENDPETANTANAADQFIVNAEAYNLPPSTGGSENLLGQLGFALSLLSSVTGIPPIYGQALRIIMLLAQRSPTSQLAGVIQLITVANSLISRKTVNPITHASGGNPLAAWPPG